MNAPTLKAPFPYFGGKSRIAGAIWGRFGQVQNYVEPFAGSLAVLLACPCPGHTETVNDADGEHAVSYSGGNGAWVRACRWCEENGDNPLLRIALCGYADTWQAPAGWAAMSWKAHGGYGSQGEGRGRENARREVVWFSPHCLNPAELARDAMTRPIRIAASDLTGTLFDESESA